jgi:hypothetical protein
VVIVFRQTCGLQVFSINLGEHHHNINHNNGFGHPERQRKNRWTSTPGYVFILDPWWNPAVETQSIDRTHRIGCLKRAANAHRVIRYAHRVFICAAAHFRPLTFTENA